MIASFRAGEEEIELFAALSASKFIRVIRILWRGPAQKRHSTHDEGTGCTAIAGGPEPKDEFRQKRFDIYSMLNQRIHSKLPTCFVISTSTLVSVWFGSHI